MPDPHNQDEIEALADSLSACADALHTRLMRAIRRQPQDQTSGLPGISQGAAQALFENEVTLRQRANSLYLDAAVLAARGLGGHQQQMLDLTARAQEKIRKLDRLRDLIDLTAELLSLGAAVATGKPEQILSPLEKLKHHIDALQTPG
jgi:HAMP domain-containing protein